ncbi:MAG TPA: hypothetical protein ENI11_04035 [Actinobacteria bacterium]|nr:hypothetical protein [Actinomycetota bacterium]
MRGSLYYALKQVITATAILLFAWANTAGAVTTKDLRKVESNIDNAQSKIRQGDSDKSRLNDEIISADQRLATINTELSKISTELTKTQKAKASVTNRLDALRARLARSQASLDRAIERLETLTITLNKRAESFYKNGDISLIEVLLESQSFSDFLVRARFLQTIISLDTKLVSDIKTTKAKILKTRAAIDSDKKKTEEQETVLKTEINRLAGLSAEQQAKRNEEKVQKTAKEQTIAKIDSDRESWLAAEAEFSRSAARIRLQLAQGNKVSGKPSVSGFIWPAAGSISSGFGPRWGRMHEGLDISVAQGTPVVASKAGKIVIAEYYGGYGNLVVVNHGGGVETWYGHNSSFTVSVGQNVNQGQVIAKAGSTGNSTGPHVHFEVRINGAAKNPSNYLP